MTPERGDVLRLSVVTIHTSDLLRSREFYAVLLQKEMAVSNEDYVQIDSGNGTSLCIDVGAKTDEPLLIFSTSDLETTRARLESAIPDTHVYVTTEAGKRLSESAQDSYTFRYGLIHLGARDRRDLRRKLANAKKLLGYRLIPVE